MADNTPNNHQDAPNVLLCYSCGGPYTTPPAFPVHCPHCSVIIRKSPGLPSSPFLLGCEITFLSIAVIASMSAYLLLLFFGNNPMTVGTIIGGLYSPAIFLIPIARNINARLSPPKLARVYRIKGTILLIYAVYLLAVSLLLLLLPGLSLPVKAFVGSVSLVGVGFLGNFGVVFLFTGMPMQD